MSRLKAIVLGAEFVERDGGKLIRVQGEAQRYIDDVAKRASITSPLKVVAACGNGTAGAFVVEALQKMGVAEVVPMGARAPTMLKEASSKSLTRSASPSTVPVVDGCCRARSFRFPWPEN